MTTKDLEALIDERSKKQIEEAKASIKSEMGDITNVADEKKFNEAVEKAVGKVLEDNKKALEENSNMLLNFEKANAENAMKGLKKETSTTVVNEMIGSYLKAMTDKNAMNGKQVSPEEALASAKKLYPNSKALHAVLGQKILTATVPADGGFTVPVAFSEDYIKALYANTILEKLGVRKVPMPNGNLSIPKMTDKARGYWIGEAEKITSSQASFGEVNLKAKKLASLSPISNDLLRYNAVGIDGWIAEDLMEGAKVALDEAFLNGTGTAHTPLGLKNTSGVQTWTPSSGTALSVKTPTGMLAKLKQANIPMQNVKWLLNPIGESWLEDLAFASGPFAFPSLDNGKLKGYDVIESSTVGYAGSASPITADFWVGDWSQFLWGVGYDISVEMSREGTFDDGLGNQISAFQRDLTLVRLITEHDFACRHPNAFVKASLSQPS
jgi:HK97 family phage major capsid protein